MNGKNGHEGAGAPLKLMVVIGSTRPGRVAVPIAEWFRDYATAHGAFEVEVVDLAELNLPFMDEPNHPRLKQYVHEHTRRWSAMVEAADAFVFISPEYNHGIAAPLKNAIDFLHSEWQYKPVSFVSYGGVSAGTRAMQMTKPIVTALKMMPIAEAVNVPFVRQFFDDEQRFQPNETTESATTAMLVELARWATALRPLRERVPQEA